MLEKRRRQILQEKLAFLLKEQALAVDPATKFNLEHQIEGLRRSLAELGDGTPPAAGPRVHNLPLDTLGALFQGRGDLLARLAERLDGGSTEVLVQKQALYGLGGIGKTRLAVEYAWRHGERYKAVFFVGAETPAKLVANLASVAGVLRLAEAGTPEADAVALVVNWLQEHRGWLVILDNADMPEAASAVTGLLPKLSGGHVLVTSRLAKWGPSVKKLPVDTMAEDDAVSFLLDRTADERQAEADDEERAAELARKLDGLPLALEQAASYVAYYRMSFAGYLASWQEQRDAVLSWHDEQLMGYPASVAATWQQSFERLTGRSRALLRLLSHLGAELIPVEMLTAGEEIVEEAAEFLRAEEGVGSGEGSVASALAELRSYSLIEHHGADVAVHRLVQEVVRGRIPEEGRAGWVERAVRLINDFAPETPSDVRTWGVWDRLRPHAARVVALADRVGVGDPTSALMSLLATFLSGKAVYSEAEPLKRRALSIDETSFGKEHPNTAISLNDLALLFQATNRLQEAEPLMRRAVEIFETSLGDDHPWTVNVRGNLEILLQELEAQA